MPDETTPSPEASATARAIRSLESEQAALNRSIAQKQARIAVLATQLSALRTGPAVTSTPVS